LRDELVQVGVREFREELAEYLSSDKPVAITRHGQTVGYFIPARQNGQEEQISALWRAIERLSRLLAEYGIDEEEVVREFQEARRAASQNHRS
jgi:antitoxin (DNA-binding transcriptional repressor) of toxin-antitoxin stability system